MSLKRRTFATILPVVVFALLQLSCAARQIRAAQDAFSEGAQIENAERAAILFSRTPPVDSPSIGTSATVSYRTALQLLDAELKNHKPELEEEKLLGPAMMLKAMTLWRLADLESQGDLAAKGTNKKVDDGARTEMSLAIDNAKREASSQLGTRDLVMADALPGLYDHDRGLQASSLVDAERFFSSAYWVVEDAITKPRSPVVAKTHQVMSYLRLAQLATLRSWKHAILSLPGGNGAPMRVSDPYLQPFVDCSQLIVKGLQPFNDPGMQDLVATLALALGLGDLDEATAQADGKKCTVPKLSM